MMATVFHFTQILLAWCCVSVQGVQHIVEWPRTKQHMSDENFRAEFILHCPEGLIRDVTELVPPGALARAMTFEIQSLSHFLFMGNGLRPLVSTCFHVRLDKRYIISMSMGGNGRTEKIEDGYKRFYRYI